MSVYMEALSRIEMRVHRLEGLVMARLGQRQKPGRQGERAMDVEILRAFRKTFTKGVNFLLLFLAIAVPSFMVAQSSATVDGIVHDPSGAVIPKAKVQLKNVASGA